MKNKIYLLISVVAILSITLNSCKKKEGCTDSNATNYDDKAKKDDGSCQYDLQSLEDHNEAEAEFDDVLSIAEDVMKSKDDDMDKSGSSELSISDTTCATIAIDTSYSANGAKGRITIDFGETNCEGADGRMRRGKIYVDYTGKYRSVGTKITATFDGYHVNDIKVEGTKTVETVSLTEYQVNVTGAKLTFTDNTTTTWESERTRTWTEGSSTLISPLDDVYEINGTASGVGRTGQSFTVDINAITVKIECWLEAIFAPVSGKIVVTPENFVDIVLDYGDGTCDKKGTVTVGDGEPTEYDWSGE